MSPGPQTPHREFADFARELALESGRMIAGYFGQRPEVTLKPDRSPVTEADRNAEERMRELIGRRYPAHGIIGEEFGAENTGAEFVWTLDPIDGTISFVSGCPLFGTLIGLLHQGRPVLGIIHQPVVGQLCLGDGAETRINGRLVRVSATDDLASARLLTTDVKYVGEHQDPAGFEELVRRTGLLRTWGDCYGYLLVASGGAEIMLDPIVNAWDVVPLVPVIRGAGGLITGWTGGDPVEARSAVASNPALHPRILEILGAGRAGGA